MAWLRVYEWLTADARSQSAVNTVAQILKLLCIFLNNKYLSSVTSD